MANGWKPWITGVLVVGAIAMMGRNLLPMFHKGDSSAPLASEPLPPSATPPDTAIALASSPPPTTLAPAPQALDSSQFNEDTSSLSGWLMEPSRDPFGSKPRRTPIGLRPSTAPSKLAIPERRPSAPPSHRISAIAWGPGKMALVDGIAVRVGDSLRDGRVRDIRANGLVLQRGTLDTILPFGEGRKP